MKYNFAEVNKNSFILYDHLDSSSSKEIPLKKLYELLIKNRKDDVLILTDGKLKNETFHVKMLVYGADELFGEFCGNGSLCCATYLSKKFPQYKKFKLITGYGTHEITSDENHLASIKLPLPSINVKSKFMTNYEKLKELGPYTYVEMIEPHLVINADLSDEDLYKLGKMLNENKSLFSFGINVNAWHYDNENKIYIKTYERGVQRLTKSCGTGSMACIASLGQQGTFQVLTPGGHSKIIVQKDFIQFKAQAFIYSPQT